MTAPVRLRLSRARGFDLQALSRATNGLPALRVTRPGPFGNSFSITDFVPAGTELRNGYFAVPTADDAVACFRKMWQAPKLAEERREMLTRLRGHNLACWCALDAPCHADVLLEMASVEINPARDEGLRHGTGGLP